jgi:hypothetical protein
MEPKMSEDEGRNNPNHGTPEIPIPSSEYTGSNEIKEGRNAENETKAKNPDPVKLSMFQAFMHKHFPEAKAHDRWTLVFTFVIAISTFFYTIFAGWTLDEIHSGSADTHNLAVAAKNQAADTGDISQAAQDQVDAANEISDAADSFSETAGSTDNKIGEAEKDFRRMAKAAEDNAAQSKRSLDAAIDQARLDQRAWLAIAPLIPEAFDPSKPATGKIGFINTGKTPARNVVIRIGLAFYPGMLTILPQNIEPTEKSVAVLFPNAPASSVIKPRVQMPISITNPGVNGDWYGYVWGTVKYDDVFNKRHSTSICAYRKFADSGDFLQCDFGNDAD